MFKAMLSGGRFKEGAELSSNGVAVIDLPEDDADNMAMLCRVLHFQHDKVLDKISSFRLYDIGRLVDKYNVGWAITPTAECWLRAAMADADDSERQALLTASYYFQHARMFTQLGGDIILKATKVSFVSDHYAMIDDELFGVFRCKPVQCATHARAIERTLTGS